MIKDYLQNVDWKKSGHEDVFKYRVAMLNLQEESEYYDFSVTTDIRDCDLIISEFFYHNIINPVIFAAENEFLNDVKKEAGI